MKILLIVGSLRKDSFNRRIANAAYEDLKDHADVQFLNYRNLPILSADETYPFSPEAERVRKEILEADALWIFCPEYNGAVPGGLKNLLDIASLSIQKGNIASGTPLKGKPVAISGAGGRNATASARQALTVLLKRCLCKVMVTPQCGFALPASAFADNIWEPDQTQKEEISLEAQAFLKFIKENRQK